MIAIGCGRTGTGNDKFLGRVIGVRDTYYNHFFNYDTNGLTWRDSNNVNGVLIGARLKT